MPKTENVCQSCFHRWREEWNKIRDLDRAILHPDSGRLTSLICRAVSKTISKPVSLQTTIVVELATYSFFSPSLSLSKRGRDFTTSSSVYRCSPPRNLSSTGKGMENFYGPCLVSFPTNDPTFLLIHLPRVPRVKSKWGRESRELEKKNSIQADFVSFYLFIYLFLDKEAWHWSSSAISIVQFNTACTLAKVLIGSQRTV